MRISSREFCRLVNDDKVDLSLTEVSLELESKTALMTSNAVKATKVEELVVDQRMNDHKLTSTPKTAAG